MSKARTSSTKGVNDQKLKTTSRLSHADQSPQALLTHEAVREFIEACTCPLCGRGPFKVLSVHTNKAHGIDKYELRDMAGLSTKDPITSADYRANAREHALRRGLGATVDRAPTSGKAAPMRMTAKGRERIAQGNRDKIEALGEAERSAQARRAALSVTPDGRARRNAATANRTRTPEARAASAARFAVGLPQRREDAARRKAETLSQHGTPKCYMAGCRCGECKAAHAAKARARRAARAGA